MGGETVMAVRTAILVNGANGHLGKATINAATAQTADRPVLKGVRRQAAEQSDAVLIASDGAVDAIRLAPVAAIINCAGQVTGPRESVWQANVEHAVRLATIAKAAGVRRFVQVSSFSIFGHAELIDAATELSPVSVYGESKLAAEAGLRALQDDSFSVICVRLPFMFGTENPAMMGSLIKALSRLPVLPVSQQPARRSMLTYKDAAHSLVQAALGGNSGAICAADPNPFTYDMLAEKMRKNGQRPARFVRLPHWLCRAAIRVAPGIGRRLFGSSVVSNPMNVLSGASHLRGVEAEIEAILAAN
jgi:nucleoside-diphosphate-sugar epimerase